MEIVELFSSATLIQWSITAGVIAFFTLAIRNISLSNKLKNTVNTVDLGGSHEIDKKLDDIAVMCQSLVGLGKHLQRIERRLGELEANTGGPQSDSGTNTPYRQAAVMLDMGANLNDLVDSLEMSQAEAKLFQVLHGDMQNREVSESRPQ
ncbi:MAG: DUF2802 domain-containing protein [Gammaproteobacteria bacterium]|nr:DUF2802 domain-containing protein [Gammaproteobacteria bacterium]